MKLYETVFLELLKAGMWGRKPHVPQGFAEWTKVVMSAKSQSVLGVVAQVMLSDEDVSSQLPQDMKARLKKFLMNNLLTHNLLNNTLIKVVSTLREGGVESVLLKGQGLARNYPQPELRQCGDIDLYVGLENGERVHDLLSPIAEKVDGKEYITVGKHYHVQHAVVKLVVCAYVIAEKRFVLSLNADVDRKRGLVCQSGNNADGGQEERKGNEQN